MKKQAIILPAVQGAYYLLTGLWAVIDIDSFMLVTGPKDDVWLVKMVGLLAASAALTLLYHALQVYRARQPGGVKGKDGDRPVPEGMADTGKAAAGSTCFGGAPLLGLSTAFSFLAIDVYYVLVRIIPPVYLADAVVQMILIGWWAVTLRAGQQAVRAPDRAPAP